MNFTRSESSSADADEDDDEENSAKKQDSKSRILQLLSQSNENVPKSGELAMSILTLDISYLLETFQIHQILLHLLLVE